MTTTMGLKPNWRALTHSSSASPAPSVASGASLAGSSAYSQSRKGSLKRSGSFGDLGRGAFTDENLVEHGRHSSASSGSKHPHQMVVIEDSSSDENKEDIKPIISQLTLPKPRAARNVVSDEKSLSINSLPDWAKLYWKSQFVPSLLDLVGSKENPWDTDRKQDNTFIQILQDIVDALYTGTRYSVEKNCKIFRMVRPFLFSITTHRIVALI